jgi:hypothetical protein
VLDFELFLSEYVNIRQPSALRRMQIIPEIRATPSTLALMRTAALRTQHSLASRAQQSSVQLQLFVQARCGESENCCCRQTGQPVHHLLCAVSLVEM